MIILRLYLRIVGVWMVLSLIILNLGVRGDNYQVKIKKQHIHHKSSTSTCSSSVTSESTSGSWSEICSS
jgi:hypothetical protein